VRLAAILLVLFAEEGLLHNKTSILGLLSPIECFQVLKELVHSRAISHNDLLEAVAAVDTEGNATILVCSPAINALWEGVKKTRRARSMVGCSAWMRTTPPSTRRAWQVS
jgi:hypothetical protein